MKTLLVGFFVTIHVCCAAVPTPCDYPEQWEARLMTIDSVSKKVLSRLSYDGTTKRLRMVEEMEQGLTRDYFETLYHFNIALSQGKEYKRNLRTRQCNVTSINGKTNFRGISPGATFVLEGIIGENNTPTDHLTAQVWDKEFKDKSRLITTVSFPDCIPISSTFVSDKTGFVQYNYFDLALGISDPSVFIPPSECI